MKSTMELYYYCDTDVRLTVSTNAEGLVIRTIDGSNTNHFSISTKDAQELISILNKSINHYNDLNKE